MNVSSGEHGIGHLALEFVGKGLPQRLSALARMLSGPMVFTTSFGLEDQALVHAICEAGVAVDIVTLDTGRLFPETYDLWAETEASYGRQIRAFYPEAVALETLVARQGINGFRDTVPARLACCGVRKTEPLERALAGAAVWITGLRSEQSAHRAETPFVALDGGRG